MLLAYRQPLHRRRAIRRLRLSAALAAVVAASGCQSAGSYWTAWRMGTDSSLSKPPTKEEMNDDRSLMARWLSPKASPYGSPQPRSSLILGSDGWKPMKAMADPKADAEFQAASRLFEQGKLEEAETAFKLIAKKRKGSPWGEKSQFYLAESQFQRGKLVAAHDSLEVLHRDYPGTMYLDKLVSREYAIAQTWLAQSDPKAKPEQKLPWTAHFDGRLPLLDVPGNGLKALEHVRQHDPTGPLADDAVLRIADQHMADGTYDLAAMHYDQLSTDHPKSPHVQQAQLASIEARMKAYIGPEYNGSGLSEARKLIQQHMEAFPDRPINNEKLFHTLDLINDAQAERDYLVADYYRRTGKVISAEYYFGKVRHRYPKSPWAVKAKTQLAALAKMPRKEFKPSKIMSRPGMNDPSSGGPGGMGGMGGMGGGGMGGMGMGPMGGMN